MKCVFAAVLVGAASLWAAGAASAADLPTGRKVRATAEYKTDPDYRSPVIDVLINGHPAKLEIDTGSARTIIFKTVAEKLGLNPHYNRAYQMYGVGGGGSTEAAEIAELNLGGVTAHRVNVIVVGRSFGKVDGLLGEDFLGHFDMELDLADHAVRLFKTEGCSPAAVGDRVVYWNKPYSLAPIVASNDDAMLQVNVDLNGRRVLAFLDTGGYASVVEESAAQEAHVTAVAAGSISGTVGDAINASVATFPTISVGDETVKNAKLQVADLWDKDREVNLGSRIANKIEGLPRMLLGADFISAHRMFIARSQGKIYFSYNGGPIFDLKRPAAETQAPKPDEPKGAAPKDATKTTQPAQF